MVQLWIFAICAAGCGDHAGHASWRDSLFVPMRAASPSVSEVEYPPFSEGIFPCSRCHEGGDATVAPGSESSFAHALHLEEGLGCEDCHMPDGGADPAPAKVEFCRECHEDPAQGSEGVKAYFESIADGKGGYVIASRWASDELASHHPAHAKAKLSCDDCHGKPVNGPLVKPRSVPLMKRCIACHEERKVSVACDTCHTRTVAPQHADIVLHHAEEQRGCFGCHDPVNRDVLRLANGRSLRFERSYLLCGQCHGPKLRDWRVGLHGKRTGDWNGTKKYLLCVNCHSPHAPRFPPMTALPRPLRPEEIR